jgi:hypothetical protein
MIFEEEDGGVRKEVVRASSRYYAVPIPRLLALCGSAGFVAGLETSVDFFQPLISGRAR